MTSADGAFRHFFDTDSEFSQAIFGLINQQGEQMQIKMSYLYNESDIDLVDYTGPGGVKSQARYRVVESPKQLSTVASLVLSNMLNLEKQCDLKNAYEIGYFLVSFKGGESELNFLFPPVFVKNFKLSEAYSSWVQFKNLLLSIGRDPTYNSPNRQAVISHMRQKLPASRLCLVAFVESGADKYHGSSTALEEITKLYLDLKDNPEMSSARRMSEASSTHEHVQPQQEEEFDQEDPHQLFLQNSEEYVAEGTDLLRTGTELETIQEWLDQAEPHQHKLEMMLGTCEDPRLSEINKRLQRKLKNVRDTLQERLYSPRPDQNQSNTSQSQGQQEDRHRQVPSSQKDGSGVFQQSKLYGTEPVAHTIGLPPQSPANVTVTQKGTARIPKRKNSSVLGNQVYDTVNLSNVNMAYQRKFNPEEYNRKFVLTSRLLCTRIRKERCQLRSENSLCTECQ